MKVLITGGGGFLGSRLADALRDRGTLVGRSGELEPIEVIRLLDARFPTTFKQAGSAPTIEPVIGDIGDRDTVFGAATDANAIFHLASMVSGECEERFDDALRVNLDGGRHLFEAARHGGRHPRVVFASSIACFGGDPAIMRSAVHSDTGKPTPQTTYGMTKVIGELMINDYTRKDYFDGRSARLPTVIIRPGIPNAAASSWASGMFREPLHGLDCELPVRRDQRHPMTGYRTVIESLIALHELPGERLGNDRACGFPAHVVTPNDAERVVREVADELGLSAGNIVDGFDPDIQSIVDRWPTAIETRRAIELGLPQPPPLETIVREYVDDYLP